jgi:hypothetical protein
MRTLFPHVAALAFCTSLFGCAAEVPAELEKAELGADDARAGAQAGEITNETAERYTRGSGCRVACSTLYGLACAVIAAECLAATSVAIGSLIVPCAQARILGCGAGAGAATACAESCPL